MRTRYLPFVALLLVIGLGCGGEEEPPTAATRIVPDPPADPAEGAEDPVVSPSEPTPPSEPGEPPPPAAPEPPAPEVDLAIPASPPLPAPPSDPARAHVFAVSDDEDQDFGDEDDLSESDLNVSWRLFIPEAALRTQEDVTIPVPSRRDADFELEIQYPAFGYADPRLTQLVNERVAAFARAQVSTTAPGVECTGIATAHLVSVRCAKNSVNDRYDIAAEGYGTMTLRVEGGELRPMTIAEAFVPGADLPALLAQGCERYVAREEAEDFNLDCRPSAALVAHASFASQGVEVGADQMPNESPQSGSFLVPYDELAPHLLARGPLAQSLYRRRAETREIAVDASARPAIAAGRRVWAIGPMSSTGATAMIWSRLAPAQREALSIVDGYLVAPSGEAARTAGSALGLDAREVEVPVSTAQVTLRAQQTTRETPLRLAPQRRARIARTLPRGTLVVATGETIDGHVRVFATAEADGYVDARALGAADPCAPDLATVLAALPESARTSAASSTLRVLTRQAGGARAIFATELGGTLHVALHRVSDACVIERAIARFDRPGTRLTYLGLTHSERRAGQALIVTAGAGDPGQVFVHTYEGGRELFAAPLGEGQSVAVGRAEGELWFPLVVLDEAGESAGAFVWSGETLAPAPPPPAPAAAP